MDARKTGQAGGRPIQSRQLAAEHCSVATEPNGKWAKAETDETLIGRRAAPLRASIARLLGAHTHERARRKGGTGERVTAWWLGRLPEGWHLLNDIPVGERGANIDHLIVGPAGVFTANAKNLTGKVWIGPRCVRHNGHPTSYLPESTHEAQRASRMLSAALGRSVTVRPVLAILADGWTVKEQPTDVFVGAPRGVKDWLLRLPAVLGPHDVIEIIAAAAKSATWHETHSGSSAVGVVRGAARERAQG